MTNDDKATGFCTKCKKNLKLSTSFYAYRDGSGYMDLCRKCACLRIDNFKPDTYTWILKELDFPYVPSFWNALRDKHIQEKGLAKLNSNSVMGKYLAKMRLNQYNERGWADSEALIQEIEEGKARAQNLKESSEEGFQELLKERFENGEITEAEYQTYLEANKPEDLDPTFLDAINGSGSNQFDETQFMTEEEVTGNIELTEDEKRYLAIKWGRLYKPIEWVTMEKHYEDMCKSFDISDTDSKTSLIFICKMYLKMNQALDVGDYNSYKTLSASYDSMRKLSKFTALQNTNGNADSFDAIGQMVALCEKTGGKIERYATDEPKDSIDLILKDNHDFVYNLVTQELGFGQQIEDALKRIQIQNELEEEEAFFEDNEIKDLVEDDYLDLYDEKTRNKEEEE